MKIVAFVVLVECPKCDGKGRVPGGQLEYGELVECWACNGQGSTQGTVDYESFAKLLTELVAL